MEPEALREKIVLYLKGEMEEFGDYFKTWNWETGFRYSRNDGQDLSVGVVSQPGETLGERHREQEGEQHLDSGQRHPELVQELDQLTVVALVQSLGHA